MARRWKISAPRRGIVRRGRRGPEDRREVHPEEELLEEESSQEEQEEENQTNHNSAIAFVKTCLSVVDLHVIYYFFKLCFRAI